MHMQMGVLFSVHLETGSIRVATDLNELPMLPGVPGKSVFLYIFTHAFS